MDDHNSLKTKDCYKNISNHMNCSKSNFAISQENYKKVRTSCILCYNIYVLAYYKNKFCPNSSRKSDVSNRLFG